MASSPPPSPSSRARRLVVAGLLLLAWISSCGGERPPERPPPTTDARRFIEAALSPEHETARGLCLAITDQDLKGQCIADLARLHGAAQDRRTLDDCEALKPGPWRDECFFFHAEGRCPSGDWWSALRSCSKTDDKADDCFLHVLHLRAEVILESRFNDGEIALSNPARQRIRRVPARDLAASMAEMAEEYERAIDLAGEAGMKLDPGMAKLAWRHLYSVVLSASEPMDPAICDPLPEPHQAPCREIAGAELGTRVGRAIQALSPGARRALCEQNPAGDTSRSPGDLARELGVEHSAGAELHSFILQGLAQGCRAGWRP